MCALDHETLPRRRARARKGSYETPAPSRTKKMSKIAKQKNYPRNSITNLPIL